jgi:hypothetical protein
VVIEMKQFIGFAVTPTAMQLSDTSLLTSEQAPMTAFFTYYYPARAFVHSRARRAYVS